MKKEAKFRFLTMDQFNRLTRKEKAVYLEQAAAEITKLQLGDDPPPQSLFKNGPPWSPAKKKPAQPG